MFNYLLNLVFILAIILKFINLQLVSTNTWHDLQQSQVPVRRINISYSLSPNPIKYEDTVGKKMCPQCVDKHLVQHYMTRGCRPIIKGGCECPSRYQCPETSNFVNQTNDCRYRGQTLALDSSVVDDNICRLCKCVSNGQYIHIDCSQPIAGCLKSERLKNDDKKCQSINCDLKSDPRLMAGCTPVYSDTGCCPIDYKCPKSSAIRVRGLDSDSFMCEFETRKYPIGSALYSSNKCHKCVCRLPPQFTCIQPTNCF
ncbi:uncharacterized protein LOC128953696 [Oppia nitens]|uniref:uncharacterized protein LOC128953696 n=1 Tax=Oppia nitens TaxID=1686743 RepID=UPI0023DC89BE|nr:uncharacterized protein LOC128953696 [Oppia nitens]